MNKYYWPLVAMLFCVSVHAQNTYKAVVKDSLTKEPLPGAILSIRGTSLGGGADVNGFIEVKNIPDGSFVLVFRYMGYRQKYDTFVFPLNQLQPAEILLSEDHEEMEEVVITSTRSSRSINDIPTRVEFIAGEELEEKANMKPGDIRVVLSESTGIQTQQTSATSANASIRIQGLDGRYTQLLKDGLPLYSGASSGLGLLQIPPLDLKQVEVIKGSASTLYGGGAIAGLVNLVSKTPGEKRELSFLVNGTSAGGFDASGFYSERFGKTGTTVFVAHNRNAAYDPAGIDLSAIPRFRRYTVNPRLFYYPDAQTTVSLGINASTENRIGGDMHYIKGSADSLHGYYEKNLTQRVSSQLLAERKFGKCSHLTFKNSVGYFNRRLSLPGYAFNGEQYATFSELNFADHAEKFEWIAGVNLWTDQFTEPGRDSTVPRSYRQVTTGFFVQSTWKASERLHVESGLRMDYVADYGGVMLPRVSLLYKFTPALTSRLGGGLGYKTPTIFTEESERIQYRNVKGIDPAVHALEKSYGANWDVNYRTVLFGNSVSFQINHLLFYTRLNNPLVLLPEAAGYTFVNISGYTESMGMETNVKLGYRDFKWFVGYTLTDTRIHQGGASVLNPLTARHRVNSVLIYEVHEKWKIGVEGYYFSRQLLSDGTNGRQYAMFGLMAERMWEKLALYINFENFTDARQTRFGSIYTGTVSNPVFRDIYAPLDGFVVNGGIKIKL